MGVTNVTQTNFTAGELSPRLHGHFDITKYKNGLKTAKNCRILPHGPVTKRNGSYYTASCKDHAKKSRCIGFQFDQDNAYIIEMGDLYFRFYRDDAQILSAGVPYEVPSPYTESELFEIVYRQFGKEMYFWHSNHPIQKLIWTSDTVWTLEDFEFSPVPTYENGWPPPGTVTPAATSGNGVNFTASLSVFVAGDVGREIQNLAGAGRAVIVSLSSATVVVCDIIENFPSTSAIPQDSWKLDLSPLSRVTPSGVRLQSIITLSASELAASSFPASSISLSATSGAGVTVTASQSIFLSTHVGKEIFNVGDAGKATITAYTSATQVTVTVTETFPNTLAIPSGGWKLTNSLNSFRTADIGKYVIIHNGVVQITQHISLSIVKGVVLKALDAVSETVDWTLEEPVWSVTNGYPATGGLHQQRLFAANTDLRPLGVWASETGIFDSMGRGSKDSDALDFIVTAKDMGQITWLSGIRGQLGVGGKGAEITVDSGTSAGALTPSQLIPQERGHKGSNIQQVVGLDDEIIYVQRSARKLPAFRYDFQIDNYVSEDLLFLSEHLSESGIKEVAYAQDPDRTIYCVLNDGRILACTYVREQQVVGWSSYETDGEYESVATISTGEVDEVWVVVKRTINGATRRYIERFDSSDGSSNNDGFSDSYLTYSQPKTVISVTQANPALVTVTAHGYSNGDYVRFFNVIGMTELEGQIYKINNVTVDTFELQDEFSGSNIDSSSYLSFSSGIVHKLVINISGLDHLEGKIVQVKVDGATHNDKTVSGGVITLDRRGYEVCVGLQYNQEVTTLEMEFNLGVGTQQGQPVRWVNPMIQLLNSSIPLMNGKIHPSRIVKDILDKKIDLFSGRLSYPGTEWSSSCSLVFTNSYPLPCTIVALFGSIEGGQK